MKIGSSKSIWVDGGPFDWGGGSHRLFLGRCGVKFDAGSPDFRSPEVSISAYAPDGLSSYNDLQSCKT